MLEDTFHKQTSNCDLVDFPIKILLLAKTYSLVQVLLAIIPCRTLIVRKENQTELELHFASIQ